MIRAAVFDMDGLMIDSQPYWQDAQLQILQPLGVPITRQDTIDTTGMRIDDIVRDCFASSPWEGPSQTEVNNRITQRVIELVEEHQPVMPGLQHAIDVCRRRDLRLAVASSSPMKLIEATLRTLQLRDLFDAVVSGADLPFSKPHPAVYINAAETLGVDPTDCLALEDSFVGLLAAKSARMKTIIVPEPSARDDPRFVIADLQINSLDEFHMRVIAKLETA